MSSNSKKHIVIDARTRPTGTGSGRYVDRLLEHLQRLDKVNRYTILLEPDDIWQPTADNFSARECHFKRFSFNFLDQFSFGFYLKSLKPDLVHFTMTPQEPMFYFGKRVTTTHDLTILRHTRKGRLPAWLHALRMAGYRLLFWWSLKRASEVIVPSKFVKDDLIKHYPFTIDKTSLTYEASEPELEGKMVKPAQVDKPFILHVGSPLPHKNINRLAKAFSEISEKNPKLSLVLTGRKEQYFEKLEENIKQTNPAAEKIIIPGYVSDQELKWLYKNAECYVWPSLSEGFGLPGLEAMTHGCPVVSSNTTCMPEVFGEAAHYFDPEDVSDIKEKVEDVLADNKLRKQLIQKGYSQIKKFSWEKMAKQTLEIYQKELS